jgi:rubrerythrin
MGRHWTIEDIPWHRFDPAKVDPAVVEAVKAASVVEQDADDYVAYLASVFRDDPEFIAAARGWGDEELQHGRALGRWAELADPSFDFAASFARYTAKHQLPLMATESVRGSLSGELIARCMVEVGTSSFYSALRDATDEPALKAICRHIARDEVRHYKLFYNHLQRYLARERPVLLTRLRASLVRVVESNDDELAYAYYCGLGESAPYDRRRFNRSYVRRTWALYRHDHVARGMVMILKAVGLNPHGALARLATRGTWWLVRARVRHLERLAA